MQRRTFLSLAAAAAAPPAPAKPNVVYLYADDIGWGDLSCYGATKVKTPNLDRLAAQGMRFTDAHCSSATCTPSRYSLMTGEYAFRKKGTSILPGDASLIVDPERTTLASMMKRAGYATGYMGKWHLGLGRGNVDWNRLITPGPNQLGFDESFLLPATGDRVPCVWVENGRVVNLDPADPITVDYEKKVGTWPTGRENPELLKMKLTHGHDMTIVNGISRIGWMTGGAKALWKDEEIGKTITERGVGFIEKHHAHPFFLCCSTQSIHVPRVPDLRMKGTTACGTRCDYIAELDWTAGQLMAALDRTGVASNTLFIFSSDNGPVLDDGYDDTAKLDPNSGNGPMRDMFGHTPAGPWRGGKYSVYEGGTRVPFIARWPQRIKPGVSGALISQVDLLSSLASLNKVPLPAAAAPDSLDVLPALLGESKTGRDHFVALAGAALSLRQGAMKYIPPRGKLPAELYDLARDPAEQKNVAAAQPDLAARLAARLEDIRAAGRTRA